MSFSRCTLPPSHQRCDPSGASVFNGKQDLGLVRDAPRSDVPEWTQAIKDLLPASDKPDAIVVMIGVNDRATLRERPPPAKEATSSSDNAHPTPTPAAPPRPPLSVSYEFHTDKWAELYSKRIDDMIAALEMRGVPIIWVGLPAIRGTKSTADMSYLDELYRARADKAGIAYVDVWDAFVDDQGRYLQDGPDFEGQTRRLRTYDGVYFTKAGAVKLGHYVEHELRRLLSSPSVPVALPGPEERSPAIDVVGPILPLNAIGAKKAAIFWVLQSSQQATKPIHSPRACSTAAKQLLLPEVAQTISPGRAPTRVASLRRNSQTQCRLEAQPRQNPRRSNQTNPRNIRGNLRPHPSWSRLRRHVDPLTISFAYFACGATSGERPGSLVRRDLQSPSVKQCQSQHSANTICISASPDIGTIASLAAIRGTALERYCHGGSRLTLPLIGRGTVGMANVGATRHDCVGRSR